MAIIAGHKSTLISDVVQRHLSVLPIVCCQQADILRLLLRVLPDEALNEESEEEVVGALTALSCLSKRQRVRCSPSCHTGSSIHPYN